jgi:hypothetical protein
MLFSKVMLCGLALLVAACGGSSNTSPTTPTTDPLAGYPAGALSLTASPINQSAILWITPLGNLNPPGHTLPTDHIYFYFANPNVGDSPVGKRATFFAPGNGIVTDVLGGTGGADTKIFIRQTTTFQYYVDHLIPTVPIARGMTITAGQVLGTTGSSYAIDLGVINDAVALPGFVNPARYNRDTLHADAPLKYYAEPLRSQLYARVDRLGPDLDGKIDHDIAGRLVGNWFASDSGSELVFAYDTYNPDRVLIAIMNGSPGSVFSIAASDPLPKDVTVATGKLIYTLTRTQSGKNPNTIGIAGRMIVQMLTATQIRAELLLDNTTATEFTGAARTYQR